MAEYGLIDRWCGVTAEGWNVRLQWARENGWPAPDVRDGDDLLYRCTNELHGRGGPVGKQALDLWRDYELNAMNDAYKWNCR